MTRIVHTGDMHFDSPFAALPASVARLRREELRGTFLRILDSVKSYRADILLISGDMFDSRFVTAETFSFLREGFAKISDTAVFVAPGNHDFLSENSLYKTVDFGRNVHIFGEDFESVEVGDAVVYGRGFGRRFAKESLLPSSFRHTGEKAGILLMHGDVGTESDYNPVSETLLSQTGLTYAAFGHIHSYSGIRNAGEVKYAYCGIPEGRHFDEEGICGFIQGEISPGNVNLSFVPSCKRQNITLEVDVSSLSSVESVLTKIRTMLEKDNLYKIILCGNISNVFFIDTDILQKELADACLYIKVKDNTRKTAIIEEESFLEKRFTDRLSGRNDAVGRMALQFGLEALRGQR